MLKGGIVTGGPGKNLGEWERTLEALQKYAFPRVGEGLGSARGDGGD